MKVEYKLFAILCVFCFGVGIWYGIWTGWEEPVGVVGLFLTGGLCAMIGGFVWWTARKLGPRPDDDPQGNISDVEGDYGFFSPHSWWPFFLGLSGAVVFLGLAVGWWLVIIGMPLLAISAVGWVFEYFRGENAI
ncbi:cytochrome c oxidase subunit 4 [Luteipulveratus sp. YIM 133132]|uniref:Cytochrome c oxidase polypeptide 4 n=1 Tax=Luteipulveratus flavus TaxID=3031728 RepID=A0ABT6CA52_9MICO|nr:MULTISPECIES: cytochrome c oxidase subunit 4 [unclassified Luteipulveratus]MDE9366742.1 cytochrome c oxidase subunit 4 [Luteipulveratus sp. YIM 133132]MDF8265775.1 cytochrome c oxidase subunit 4 [Luteipulveratus sp. YIM 133296]